MGLLAFCPPIISRQGDAAAQGLVVEERAWMLEDAIKVYKAVVR
jgi:hypothetical protein